MKKVTKGALTIRVIAAVYLLYLAYGLMQDYAASENQAVAMAGMIVFAVCGGAILFFSLRSLVRKEYEDGEEDGASLEGREEEGSHSMETDEKGAE